jgi:DNA repair protein RecN (Recombination protein N)
VAARGNDHWRVAKRETKSRAVTEIERLTPEGRREEIARMLSGSVVTDEARRAAESLLA